MPGPMRFTRKRTGMSALILRDLITSFP